MGMWKLKRRDFLKGLGLTETAGAVLSGSNVWALNRLEPVGDTLASEYPYRSWEDLYRNEWSWDSVGHAAHCINCMGNCAWNVYVKDGIVIREEQIRSEEHTSELQSRPHLVCRLLLEKKKK